MGIHDELTKMGYRFEYERGDSEERTEVWCGSTRKQAWRSASNGCEWTDYEGASHTFMR